MAANSSSAAFAGPEIYRRQIIWRNVLYHLALHVMALYGAVLVCTSASVLTTAYAFALYQIAEIGITAGAHRLWSHRSYKATLPLRVLLMLLQTMAYQGPIYLWARDHRVHHKYSDTDADPHNPERGLFFSHLGWLLVRKHPQVLAKGRLMDFGDLRADPVVRFQQKYFNLLAALLSFVLPTAVPVLAWGEGIANSLFVASMLRIVVGIHCFLLINSVAHRWGSRPLDKSINPTNNLLTSLGTLGEGWHNYHHVYPWDYKPGELGGNSFNATTLFIDTCAFLGLAYDLKAVDLIAARRRALRTGDGSWTRGEDPAGAAALRMRKAV